VDPLDIIESHGADAMRFTLAHMATQTQDVRMPVERDAKSGKNTSPKFDIGRNFCNKLWNAVRFAIMNLSSVKTNEPMDEQKWSLADRWIVTRFNRTVVACDDASDELPLRPVRQVVLRLLLGRPVRLVPRSDQACVAGREACRVRRRTCWRRCSTGRCG
jgi:valyl-tRNA synthetase